MTYEEAKAANRHPDYIYDPDNWEETYNWEDRNLLVDEPMADLWKPKEFATLIKGPPMWAKEVVVTKDENGDPDETEVRWFKSLEDAERA